MPEFGRFFLPGPTEVHPDILESLTRPVIGHRGAAMVELMKGLDRPLRRLFRTERPVYVSTSSATGLMEAAVRNCARARVLSLVNGAFSERFAGIAEQCGLETERLVVDWGESNEPEQLANALRAAAYDAVTVVHSETSTGVLNPLEEIAATVHEHAPDTLVLVDCVTSLAAARVEVDEWGLDVALTGSQKALALPPGLALAAASQRAFERSLDIPRRGVYFSFDAFEEAAMKYQTANTPAVSLLFALAAQMERIELEGVEARWARHREMAQRTWNWVDEVRQRHGVELSVLARESRRSPSITCVKLPESLNGIEVAGELGARGYTIAPGYGKLKESTFRVGHMGDHTLEELNELLEILEGVLTKRG